MEVKQNIQLRAERNLLPEYFFGVFLQDAPVQKNAKALNKPLYVTYTVT
jgi:hypothetical protein